MLRYSSEGGYLRPAYGRLGELGNMLRVWEPASAGSAVSLRVHVDR
jgi:hypothetical protein